MNFVGFLVSRGGGPRHMWETNPAPSHRVNVVEESVSVNGNLCFTLNSDVIKWWRLLSPRAGQGNCPKIVAKPTDMIFHWQALEEHFLTIPFVIHLSIFKGIMHFLNFSQKNLSPTELKSWLSLKTLAVQFVWICRRKPGKIYVVRENPMRTGSNWGPEEVLRSYRVDDRF
jgi:hypothetical protein